VVVDQVGGDPRVPDAVGSEAGDLLRVGHAVADAVAAAVAQVEDRRPLGSRPGQYAIDLVADEAALEVLAAARVGVLSEESGLHRAGSPITAVLDPIDGSTNASRGLPYFATSCCFVDDAGPLAAVVVDQASGARYSAVRGHGSWRDGRRLQASACRELGEAIVAMTGLPRRHGGWAQFRAFGASALELCAVAEGALDGFLAGERAQLAPWARTSSAPRRAPPSPSSRIGPSW
jgi:myo-inositol-1(or 4)-monophosphatase